MSDETVNQNENEKLSHDYWHSTHPPKIKLPSAFMTLKIKEGEEKTYFVEEMALAQLLIDEVVFLNTRPYSFHMGEVTKTETVVVFAICNDIFAWGCADAEDIPSTVALEELYKMHMADKIWGVAKWCCLQRKEQPQRPVAEAMKKDGVWDESMDKLEPNYYDKKSRELYESKRTAEAQERQAEEGKDDKH